MDSTVTADAYPNSPSSDLPLTFFRESLRAGARPLATFLGLRTLPAHFDTVILSAFFFWTVQRIWSPFLSRTCFTSFARLETSKARNNWNIHAVSLVHSVAVIPLAVRCLYIKDLAEDKAFGWHEDVGTVMAFSLGYFCWDTIESIVHYSGTGFVAHGFVCTVIYLLSFKPFIAYYGPRFLLWELSTPFLNINWFLNKMEMRGSFIQTLNGGFLLISFAGVRLVYGTIMSIAFYRTLLEVRGQVPFPVILTYSVGNTILNGLNWFWFSKMIFIIHSPVKVN